MIGKKTYFVLLLIFAFVLDASAQSQKEIDVMYGKAHIYMENGLYDKAKEAYRYVKTYDSARAKDCDNYLKIIDEILLGEFTLSASSVNVQSYGGESKVKFFGAKKISVSSSEEWCQIVQTGDVLVIRCTEANNQLRSRSAEIIVQHGNQHKKLTVIQEAANEQFRISAQSLSFEPDKGNQKIYIAANVGWTIDNTQDWISLDTIGNSAVIVSVDNNPNPLERYGKIVVESELGSKREILVYQSAGNEQLMLSKNDLYFLKDGGMEYLKVSTDAREWNLGAFPEWCQVSKVGKDSIKIVCVPNRPIAAERSGSISVTTGRKTIGVNILQEAKPEITLDTIEIGGRRVSFGFLMGYVAPIISSSAGSDYSGSVVNYALGNKNENASYKSAGGFTVGLLSDIRMFRNLYMLLGLNFNHYNYYNKFSQTYERTVRTYSTLGYYTKGVLEHDYKEEYSFNTLEIPVLLSYRVAVTDLSHFQFNLGPSINYGVSAKMRISGAYDGAQINEYRFVNNHKTDLLYSNATYSVHFSGKGEFDLYDSFVEYSETNEVGFNVENEFVSRTDDAPYKRLSFGAKCGITYEYKGISVAVEYSQMLTNIASKKFWDSDRWMIFNHNAGSLMYGYKQYNNSITVKMGYTFRYR